jgi:Zn-dependent protease with chaperone function
MQAVANRIHFLDAQRRNRRTGRAAAVLVTAAIIVSGIPLSVLVSPALVAAAVVVAYIADIFTTVPPGMWNALHDMAYVAPETWRAIRSDSVEIPWRSLVILLVVPGTVLIVVIWTTVRIVFRNVGVGGILRSIGAREPAGTELKERQLMNMVEELAVAGAIAPPRVLIIDTDAANAAVIGLQLDDATVVVSKGFINQLPRAEAQAYIAHLIGSTGNGDLRIVSTILSALQTWGVVTLLIDVPFGPRARQSLRLFVRQVIHFARGKVDPKEAEMTLDLLMFGSEAGLKDLNEYLDSIEGGQSMPHPLVGLFLTIPLLVTMGVASITARLVIWTFTLLVCGPWIGVLWRARRRLADASAVELTRDPNALAGAVRSVQNTDMRIPGGETVSFLFPVWKRDEKKDVERTDLGSVLIRMHVEPNMRLAYITRLGATATGEVFEKKEPQTFRELLKFVGMILLVLAMMVILLAVNLFAASAVMIFLWWLLKLIFVRLPSRFT